MASEIKIRAERRAGELLADMDKAKGGWPSCGGSRRAPPQEPPTLADLNITKKQSSQWQVMAGAI